MSISVAATTLKKFRHTHPFIKLRRSLPINFFMLTRCLPEGEKAIQLTAAIGEDDLPMIIDVLLV
jgi:hypothetical protein